MKAMKRMNTTENRLFRNRPSRIGFLSGSSRRRSRATTATDSESYLERALQTLSTTKSEDRQNYERLFRAAKF